LTTIAQIAAANHGSGFAEMNGIPKYLAVHNRILSMIQAGSWKPGDQLPPELELARTMQVSLGTAQKALRLLADHGVVVRRQGHGTFVAGAPAPKNPNEIRHFRFLADDGVSLLPLYTRVLEIAETSDQGPWTTFFPGEATFVRITRLVNVNLEFQNYCRLVLPTSRFGMFLNYSLHDLDGAALTHFIGERFNAPTLHCVHHLCSVDLPDDVCQRIDVPIGTQGTEWEMFGYTFRNAPVSYQHVYMPPNRRRLELRDVPA
jgi:GntR family transcriptional regulator